MGDPCSDLRAVVHEAECGAGRRVGCVSSGDSPGNVITPLMAYFGMIVIFAQKYQKDAGVGTVVAMMLPYTAALYVVWTVFLIIWYLIGVPFGV